MLRNVGSKVARMARATSTVVGLAIMLALVLGVATTAIGATGGNFLLGKRNVADAISTLIKQGPGPALNLVVEADQPPLRVNSSAKVANLNADQLDGKSAEQLSRVAMMETDDTLTLSHLEQRSYGSPLSITAPAAGFVRLNGNVTINNYHVTPCTTVCTVNAYLRHVNSDTWSLPSETSVVPSGAQRANVGLDWLVPVNAGVNTFEIKLIRSSESGTLQGWWGALTAEYTPYGSTGGTTLSSTNTLRSAATESDPITK